VEAQRNRFVSAFPRPVWRWGYLQLTHTYTVHCALLGAGESYDYK